MVFNQTIYPRIFIPFMVALLVGTIVAWKSASDLFEQQLIEYREQQLRGTVQLLAEGNLPLTTDMLKRIGALLGSRLIPLSHEGQPLGSLGVPLPQEVEQQLFAATRQSDLKHIGVIRANGGDHSMIIEPIEDSPDPRVAALAALASLSQIHDTSRAVAIRLAIGASLGLLILAIIVHRIARGITIPIDRLMTMASAISTGDLGARANISRPRELATLSASFADMAKRLKQSQDRSARENRLQGLGELAARVAHELRNPLTAMKLQLQILGEQPDSASQRERVARLLEEMRRLELIVSGTLMWGKELQIETTASDLNQVVQDVVELMQPQLTHRQIDLSFHQGRLPPVSMDPDRIKQVLFNLINNAADELRSGGQIAVSSNLDDTGDMVELTVEDDGPGLSPEAAMRLFDNPQSQKTLGLGLGLQISREILVRHRGDIRVDRSQMLGGARFTMQLPADGKNDA